MTQLAKQNQKEEEKGTQFLPPCLRERLDGEFSREWGGESWRELREWGGESWREPRECPPSLEAGGMCSEAETYS